MSDRLAGALACLNGARTASVSRPDPTRTAEDSVPDEWFDYIQRNAAYYQRAQI